MANAKILLIAAAVASMLLFGCAQTGNQYQGNSQQAPYAAVNGSGYTAGTGAPSLGQSPSASGPGQGNDVTACASISSQQDRFACIANWCNSAARDYNKCYNLADENDRLGCLSKCNPNPNN
ncbi:MAG TPA: hypothetical protein PLO51_01910 [Candidatus Micrarchaeota archaeon]|nr:hypothetical protein [Candidatus Micrarchaeota archaeon]